jgi:hypothetical protein
LRIEVAIAASAYEEQTGNFLGHEKRSR